MPECQDCGNSRAFTVEVDAQLEKEYHPETGEELDSRLSEVHEYTGGPHCTECGSNRVVMD